MQVIQGGRGAMTFDGSAAVSLSPVDVQRAGSAIKVALVKIGEHEGLTTRQAAELFNVSESMIHKHIERHVITTGQLVRNMLQLLKNNGIVAKHSPHAIFIPRYGLRELMRVIGTDEAKAAYHQLFDDAEELLRIKPLYLEQAKLLKELEKQNQKLQLERNAAVAQSAMIIVEYEQAMDQVQQFSRVFKAGKRRIMRARAKQRAAEELVLKSKKAKGENRKKVILYESIGRNIFEGEQFKAVQKSLKIGEMNPLEFSAYKVQHSCRTVDGAIRKGICKPLSEMHAGNKEILESIGNLANASSDVLRKIMPEAGTVTNAESAELPYLN